MNPKFWTPLVLVGLGTCAGCGPGHTPLWSTPSKETRVDLPGGYGYYSSKDDQFKVDEMNASKNSDGTWNVMLKGLTVNADATTPTLASVKQILANVQLQDSIGRMVVGGIREATSFLLPGAIANAVRSMAGDTGPFTERDEAELRGAIEADIDAALADPKFQEHMAERLRGLATSQPATPPDAPVSGSEDADAAEGLSLK